MPVGRKATKAREEEVVSVKLSAIEARLGAIERMLRAVTGEPDPQAEAWERSRKEEKSWMDKDVMYARISPSGSLELYYGPHIGCWNNHPVTGRPMTDLEVGVLVREAQRAVEVFNKARGV